MLKASIPADAPRMWQLTPQQAREQSERFFAPFNGGGPQMAEVRDLRVPGRGGKIRARLYVPGNLAVASPGLLYLHGGGFVIGSISTHDRLAREPAQRVAARALSLDARPDAAPASPQGLDDLVDSARCAPDHGQARRVEFGRVLLG